MYIDCLMKILHTMAGAQNGGAEMAYVDMLRAQKAQGINVIAACRPNATRNPLLVEAGIPVHELPFGGVFDFKTKKALEELIILSLEEVEIDISFPNVINIGSNGQNAVFQIPAYPAIALVEELSIYDRWGEEVFKELNYNPGLEQRSWDGTMNGKNVAMGVYVFKLVYQDQDGDRQIIYGDIAVVSN